MLDVMVVIGAGVSGGRRADRRGYSKGAFGAAAAAVTLGGEAAGAVIGASVWGNYGMILLGAFVGAAIAAFAVLFFIERLPYLEGHAPPDHTSDVNYGRRRQFGAGP